MAAYRLVKTRREPLDPTGAFIHGGRWNTVGTAMLYLGSSEALCILEARVHTPRLLRAGLVMHMIETPSAGMTTMAELGLELPERWNNKPPVPASMQFGERWVKSGASLGLYVPSVVSPGDMNLLLNPAHPDFRHVRAIKQEPYRFDSRLFRT